MGNNPTVPALSHRRLIREQELSQVVPLLGGGNTVLEIGAGAGWQAEALSKHGYDVTAIDLPTSNYNTVQIWPIVTYDGEHIPLADNSRDIIFSSNVLEHVPHIDKMLQEIRRVAKPGAISVHVMPSATWRLWTSLSFYIDKALKVAARVTPRGDSSCESSALLTSPEGRQNWRRFFPTRHGVRGTFITEMFYFSRWYWRKCFLRNGWEIEAILPNRLFYTGNRLLADKLSMGARKGLSRLLGSSCIIYVLRNPSVEG